MGFYTLDLDALSEYSGTAVADLKKLSYEDLEGKLKAMKEDKILRENKQNAEDKEYERLVLKYLKPLNMLRCWFSDREIVLACANANVTKHDLCEETFVSQGQKYHHSNAEYVRTSKEYVPQYDRWGRKLEERQLKTVDVYLIPNRYQGIRHGAIIANLLYKRYPELSRFKFKMYDTSHETRYEIYTKNGIYVPWQALMTGNVDEIISRNETYCRSYNCGEYTPAKWQKRLMEKETQELFDATREVGKKERELSHCPIYERKGGDLVSTDGRILKKTSKSGNTVLLADERPHGNEWTPETFLLWMKSPVTVEYLISEFLDMTGDPIIRVHVYHETDYEIHHGVHREIIRERFKGFGVEGFFKNNFHYNVENVFCYRTAGTMHLVIRINEPMLLEGKMGAESYVKREIAISKKEADRLKKLLSEKPEDESSCFGADETIFYTADFGHGMGMDIKLCGVQFEDGEDNLPWTEAVLFDHGCEVCHTEPGDDFFGIWELKHKNMTYAVEVIEE